MKLILTFILVISLFSCVEKEYEYEIVPVTVGPEGGSKTTPKQTSEFISIAYADLFGTSIPQPELLKLSVAYASFGDLKLIEDRIIRNFLNDPSVIIPSQPSVNGDTTAFIVNTYLKFYNREPNEFEKYFWLNSFREDSLLTPHTAYYAMMTSDEYRFY